MTEEKMFCTECGAEITKNQKFCSNCGIKIKFLKICKSCGQEIQENCKYCTSCGARIEQNLFYRNKIVQIVVIVTIILFSCCYYILSNNTIKNAGIGIIITNQDNLVIVKELIPNMPALENGIQKNDIILKVNGKIVKNSDETSNMVRGKNNTKVKITILRNGKEITYKLKRKLLEEK